MTLQPDLFAMSSTDQLHDHRVNARHTDPASSAMADAEQKASGRRVRNLDRVLALLAAHPGSTSRELAILGGMDRHEAARRTADAKRLGLAMHTSRPREDRSGGRPGVAWCLTSQGRSQCGARP